MRKLLITLLAIMCIALVAGCAKVPVSEAPEPLAPVVSNVEKYEAPERSKAPEPVVGGPAVVG